MPTIDLIGCSPNFKAVLIDVGRIAPVDSAVLIQDETGTGKERSKPDGADCLGSTRESLHPGLSESPTPFT
jgi:hypothetical protein